MSYLYIYEPSAYLGVADGRITVKYKNGADSSIPIESAEGVSLFGPAGISSQCIRECLERGIDIQFYSTKGSYYGKLNSTAHVNAARQRKQALLGSDAAFCLSFAKKIIQAKIHNQIVVLRRYNRNAESETSSELSAMKQSEQKIERCEAIDELMGYEGNAAKEYYRGLGKLVVPEFRFSGRSRRPPKDPFNSMLSLGYTILMYVVYGALESRGLNPYFGFMHKDKENHPTLASDLMEEWRAVIVDSVVMSMVNGAEINAEDFSVLPDNKGVILGKTAFKAFITKLEKRFLSAQQYLPYADYPVSFRRAVYLQTGELAKALESHDANMYTPITIR